MGNSASGFGRQVLEFCNLTGDPDALEAEQYSLVAKQIEENHVPTCDGLIEAEDSFSGTIAAKKAGIYCYGYLNPTSGEQHLHHSEKIIYHLQEIIEK